MKKSDSFGKLFGESWDIFSAKFGILVSLAALFSFLPNLIYNIQNSDKILYLSMVFAGKITPPVDDVIAALQDLFPWFIFLGIFSIFLGVSAIYFLNAGTKKKAVDFISAVKGGWSFYGKGLILSVLILLFLIPLYLLLVIPGVIFQIYWMFALYVLVIERRSIMDSIKGSYKIVKGRWWKVLGYMLLFYIIIAIIGSVANNVFTLFGAADVFLQVALSSLIGIFSLVFINTFYLSLNKK